MSKPAKNKQKQESPGETLPGRRTFIVIGNRPFADAARFFEIQHPEGPENRFVNAFRTHRCRAKTFEC
jgi:hypothetical protein